MPSENSNTQYLVTKAELDEVAEAIQRKAGLSYKLHWPTEMANAIYEMSAGASFNFSGVTVTSDKMLQNVTAWNGRGNKITGNIPERLESEMDEILISPSHMTRIDSSNWGNYSPQFPAGYYSTSHQTEVLYDYSQTWEITPSTEDKTYYLLNTSDFTYNNQPNRSNITNFNSNAFPYAITIKSVPAPEPPTDWTGNGSINITPDKVLTNTYFYNTSGSIQQGNIPIQQSLSAISRKTITPANVLTSTNSLYNGLFAATEAFPAGYYMGNHTDKLKVASDTQSSIISIIPSTNSQTITLFGSDATYDYFPNAITIASASISNDEERDAQWIQNTISQSIINSQVQYVGSSVFFNKSDITTISLPNCSRVYDYAFYSCTSLQSVYLPSCTSIFAKAFQGCASLTTLQVDNLRTIGSGAFQKCSNLTNVNMSKCTIIGSEAFASCSSLISVSALSCSTVHPGAFSSCTSLKQISFPYCTRVGSSAFINCYNLSSVTIKASTIYNSTFFNCYNLLSLKLTSTSVVRLQNSNVFDNTPIRGYRNSTYYSGSSGRYGEIYVPHSLYSAYISSTYWSLISSRIHSF